MTQYFKLMIILGVLASCSTGAEQAVPIHVGRSLDHVGGIEVVATLEDYLPYAGTMHFGNEIVEFGTTKFLIIEPEKYRGETFVVYHFSSKAVDAMWSTPGKAYSMVVHQDILELPEGEEF